MSILGIKSVMLEKETNRAWKTVPGFYFVDRKRSAGSIVRHTKVHQYEAILNLGRIDLDFGVSVTPLFNAPETVRAVSSPGRLRGTLGDAFLPGESTAVPHWHKSVGFGGAGKRYCGGTCMVDNMANIQEHIDGNEYRIVTVGDKVVQASRKDAVRKKANGRNDFDYTWIGVDGIRQGGFIPLLKEAVERVPGGVRSVFGWDVIHDGERPWIIECNTSPGVNEATAGRIVRAVRGLI